MRAFWTAALLALAVPALAQDAAPDFLAQHEPPATHRSYARFAAYVPARDGTRLALTWYLPDSLAGERFPALLWYHPGHRESIDPAIGAIRPVMAAADIAFFTAHGYAVAVAEMRGSGAFFGSRELDRGPQIGRDGKDVVDWIARQPWSDGRLGMIGASYQGFAQYAVAAERPLALKAIFPEIAGFDDYTSMFHPGGIFVPALSESASASIRRDDLNMFLPESARKHLPSVPVIDEDGDGELADEIPIDRNGNGDFLDDGEPAYADGKPRQHIYYQATREHLANRNLPVELVAAAPWRDSAIAGTRHRWRDLDPGDKPAKIAASGIAVYNRGGWFDYHARDTAMWFATLRGKTPTRMMMAPVGHGGLPAETGEAIYRSGPYLEQLGDTRSTNAVMNREKLAFFDRYVKGEANGFDQRPPVLIYVMGGGMSGGWRYEREWPLVRAQAVRFALDAGGGLSRGVPTPGADRHAMRLDASSLSQGANRWNFQLSTARQPMTLDGGPAPRPSWQSPPLDSDTEVTGHPLLDLALSSDTPEGDVFAYLEDVAPDGTSLLVTEGQLRANYYRLKRGGPAPGARPVLPWQGFARADYVPRPFAAGKVVRLKLDMMPTAWLFRKGHHIRLSLAAADWPSFALHPGLSPANNPASARAPVWAVHRGAGLSAITLPVVPQSK
jgi:uncharacterized protein